MDCRALRYHPRQMERQGLPRRQNHHQGNGAAT
ncbi:winged-helix domain-containing protein [Arthrobacter sp. Y81]